MLAAVSYYFPGGSKWEAVNAVDPAIMAWLIINPDSGPGYGSTWAQGGDMHQLYTAQVAESQGLGHTVLAYLTTNYRDAENGTQRQFRFTADQATDTFTRIMIVDEGEPTEHSEPAEHGLPTGFGPVWVSNEDGALPSGLGGNTNYWVISDTISMFRLADSESHASAGVPVGIGTEGTGTQWLSISRSLDNIQNVLDEVDLYLERYPTLQGFFYDEMNHRDNAEDLPDNLAYYQAVFDHAHSRGLLVVQNPGTNFPEPMVGVADTFMSFEGTKIRYEAFMPSDWQSHYPSTKFWHCIKNVSSTEYATVYERTRTLRVGYIWIDEAAAEYTEPPSYLEALAALDGG